ncbi:MAG: hypothetical protein PHV82_04890 [Victivallaceae bacterium]|nr:hypothetical protein [Victivallaceae bacterium]
MKKFFILFFVCLNFFVFAENVTVTTSNQSAYPESCLSIYQGPGTYTLTYVSGSWQGGGYTANLAFCRYDDLVDNLSVGLSHTAPSSYWPVPSSPVTLTVNSSIILCLGTGSTGGPVVVSYTYQPFDTAPSITSATSLSKTGGESFSYTIAASGTAPITFTVTDLPAYLSFDGVNKVTGTLPYSGTGYNCGFNVTATNSVNSDTKTVLVNVAAAGGPVWADSITNNFQVGDSVSITVVGSWVTGYTPITVVVQSGSTLPSFLTLVNGVLTGTCTSAGTYNFTLQATNDYGVKAKAITFTVAGVPPVYVGILPCVLDLHKGASFSINLKNVWNGADSVTFTTDLPSWASVSNSILSGTVPTSETRQNITGLVMKATNTVGYTDITMTLNILSTGTDSFYFTSAATSQGIIGQPFSYQASTNQSSGVTYSMSAAPSWLSCSSSGAVTGSVPSGITGFSFTITATHSELGSVNMTVQCSAVTSSGSGDSVVQHVVVDNFNDFGSTGFAENVESGITQLLQNTSTINMGVDSVVAHEKLIIDALGPLSHLEGIHNDTSSINNQLSHLEGIHNDTSSINSQMSGISSALTSISDKMPDVSAIEDKLDELQETLDADTEDNIDAPLLPAWTAIKNKLSPSVSGSFGTSGSLIEIPVNFGICSWTIRADIMNPGSGLSPLVQDFKNYLRLFSYLIFSWVFIRSLYGFFNK